MQLHFAEEKNTPLDAMVTDPHHTEGTSEEYGWWGIGVGGSYCTVLVGCWWLLLACFVDILDFEMNN